VGAGYDGTRVWSAYESGERMSEADMKKGRSLDRERGPQGVEVTGSLLEDCLLAPHCGRRHRPSTCEKLKDLSLQHRQSVIAEKELCVRCLRHSDLDKSKKKECIRRGTPPHWLGSDVKRPDGPQCQDRDLPPVEAKAGRSAYACRINIRVKTKSDSHKEAHGASLATLFSATRQMSAIALGTAIEQGLPYRVVPEVNVMLGDGHREKSPGFSFWRLCPTGVVSPGRHQNHILWQHTESKRWRPPPRQPLSCPSYGKGLE
jgi:hypothetical protein